MRYILFLDDSTFRSTAVHGYFPNDNVMAVRTVRAAIDVLETGMAFDLVMLDHDLGGEAFVDSGREDSGMEVVRWIEQNNPVIARIVVHSWNPPAAHEMVERLRGIGYDTSYQPFGAPDTERRFH